METWRNQSWEETRNPPPRLAHVALLLAALLVAFCQSAEAADESTMGSWSSLIDWSNLPPTLLPGGDDHDDFVATHAMHLVPATASGDTLLLLVGESHLVESGTKTRTLLFNQKFSGTGTGLSLPANDAPGVIFCAGHAHLSDGKILATGNEHYPPGDPCAEYDGALVADIFDPQNTSEPWKATTDMCKKRSYPTCTASADGRMIVTTGDTLLVTNCTVEHGQFRQEVYLPEKAYWSLYPTDTANSLLEVRYPAMFSIPTGELLHAGENLLSQHPATLTWRTHSTDPIASMGIKSPAVIYRPDRIMRIGGYNDTAPYSALSGAYTINMTGYALGQTTDLSWQATDNIFSRGEAHLVLLPDGQVLLVGGALAKGSTTYGLRPQMYDPNAASGSKWSTMATMSAGRSRHSIATLMYDGRVLVAGGHPTNEAQAQNSAQIYSPPYLYNSIDELIADADRIHSVSAPSNVEYAGIDFNVDYRGTQAATVSLVKLAATTHSFDEDQRYIPLTIKQHQQNVITGLRTVTLAIPPATTAAPGHYMLFLVDSNGTPSKAKYVHIWDGTLRWLPAASTDVAILTGTSSDADKHKKSWMNDNVRLSVARDGSATPRASVKVVCYNATPPSTFVLDRVDIVVENRASGATPFPALKVYLRDYAVSDENAPGAWDQVGGAWYQLGSDDQTVKISVTNMASGTYARYVSSPLPQWEAMVKLQWHPAGVGDDAWVVELDEATVKIKGH